MPAPICKLKNELSYKTHMVILKYCLALLFNFAMNL